MVSLWCYAWLAWYLNSHNLSAGRYATFYKFILGKTNSPKEKPDGLLRTGSGDAGEWGY